MKTDEITILEQIARDEDKNPSARCTAVRTLLQIEQDRAGGRLDEQLAEELDALIKPAPPRRD